MTNEIQEKLAFVKKILHDAELYDHACRVLNFDQETICPAEGMEEQGEINAFLSNKAFELIKQDQFVNAAEYLFRHINELEDPLDRVLTDDLHREYLKTKNITTEMDHTFSLIYNKAFVNWVNAKQKADYTIFSPSLKEVQDVELKKISLREQSMPEAYDNLLDDYERGMRVQDLDAIFDKCRKRLIPLLKKITASEKTIRTDFLTRTVTDEQQKQMARYLLETIGFDFTRGAFTTTEHPFTDGLGCNDVRVTTHYYPNMFASSMFSIIHEGGHALFELNQPAEDWKHYINGDKTMGMHESVSRFYENRIGRSKAFIHLIYDKTKQIFPEVLYDVSEQELYEALNVVRPSLIRTEADEFTYTFHIIIRYELEKQIINGRAEIENLPRLWNDMYEKYLGIRPQNDREGILQDVHWSSGFGYFTTYALGNMYNALYYNTMCEEFDVEEAVLSGDFAKINGWMKEHVWKNADRETPKQWLYEITGRDFTVDPYLDYLEEKYTALYDIRR
ncbi:MAG: carboxypeptidase M32 [Treponema sp.]|nr:carboxypeptidase M32 [Treponema sp.]